MGEGLFFILSSCGGMLVLAILGFVLALRDTRKLKDAIKILALLTLTSLILYGVLSLIPKLTPGRWLNYSINLIIQFALIYLMYWKGKRIPRVKY